jgi:pimeloyl-ACP methyl ester carboxylesterase
MPHRDRAPIHLGSGEPILLLHPYLLSQNVWHDVAPQLAETGRYEVFAPTMLGHNGAPHGPFFLSVAALADHVEHQLDELGWGTAHIVGNSLGGWVAFELERRGRARTLTAIAPAGGWTRFAPGKFKTIFTFVLLMPGWLLTRVLGPRVLSLPFSREFAYPLISASPEGLSETDLIDIVDDFAHCPAYYRLLGKALALPGLLELAETRAATHLVICEKDRVFPPPRFSPHFTTHLPADTRVTTLDGVGHVPMFEAPGRIAELILEFVDQHTTREPRRPTG